MNIEINNVNFQIHEDLKELINEKVGKVIKFYPNIIKATVICKLLNTHDSINKQVEILLAVPGNDIFIKKESESFEKSLELSVQGVKRLLVKKREKEI